MHHTSHIQTPLFLFSALIALLPTTVLSTSFQQLNISSHKASITDSYWPAGSDNLTLPDFILIQDLHHHPEVQSDIASILMQGSAQWGVQKVYVEGAFAPVNLNALSAFPEDQWTGAERAALDLQGALQLVGMEDPDLYHENIQAYQDVQRYQMQALEELGLYQQGEQMLGMDPGHPMRQQLERTRQLIQLKLTPMEYQRYLRQQVWTPSGPTLDKAVSAARRFYALADQRSRIFLQRIQNQSDRESGPRVIVVGGFHTHEMADVLRKEGRSFVVLSPHITHPGGEALYARCMEESISALQIPSN